MKVFVALVVPSAWLSKFSRLLDREEAGAAAIPLPFSVSTCVVPVASSVKVRVAVSAAATDGLKVIHIGQLVPGWSCVVLLPQALGLLRVKSAALVPLIAGFAEKVTAAVPVFRIDTRSPTRPSLL